MVQNMSNAAEVALPIYSWINLIGLGTLCGAIGQGARTIVSLKKVADEAQAKNIPFAEVIQLSKILIAFLIGAVAGAIAAIVFFKQGSNIPPEQIFMLIGAGYVGADFIEGFISKVIPADQSALTPSGESTTANSNDADGALG